MAQITWRDIAGPDFGAANNLIARGQEQFLQATNAITQGANNFAVAQERENTNRLMDYLYKAKDPTQFNSEGFQQGLDDLRSKYGNNIDSERFRTALDNRLGKLQTDAINAQNFQDQQDEVYNRPLLTQYYQDLSQGKTEEAQGLLKNMRGNTAQALLKGVDLRKSLLDMDNIKHGWSMDDKNYALNAQRAQWDHELGLKQFDLQERKFGFEQDQYNDQLESGGLGGYGVGTNEYGEIVNPNGSASGRTSSNVQRYSGVVAQASKTFGVSPIVINSIMTGESGGDPNARSSAGASGLMQLMPTTARALGVTNIHDPQQNIMAGVKYYKQLFNKYGNHKEALAAYNMGPGAYDSYKAGKRKMPAETKRYVAKNMSRINGAVSQRNAQRSGLNMGTADINNNVNVIEARAKDSNKRLQVQRDKFAMNVNHAEGLKVATVKEWAELRGNRGKDVLQGTKGLRGFDTMPIKNQINLLEAAYKHDIDTNSRYLFKKNKNHWSHIEFDSFTPEGPSSVNAGKFMQSEMMKLLDYRQKVAANNEAVRLAKYNAKKAIEINSRNKRRG